MIYPTKYAAYKNRIKGREIVMRVEGGYLVLVYADYVIRRRQK